MKRYSIQLDFPPSTNTFYRRHGHVMHLSAQGKAYKDKVEKQLNRELRGIKPLTGRLRVYFGLSRYDNRSYDISNFIKCVEDSLKGILYVDDSQVDRIIIDRLPVSKSGFVEIVVEQYKRIVRAKKKKTKATSNPWKHLRAA